MGLPTFSVKKQTLTWVIFAGLIMLGTISIFLLPVELYQGTSRGIISVIIRARGGLPPVEIERSITRLVEESVSTVSHLKSMYSNSRESESRVTLEFETGTDMKFAALEVREKFSRIKGLLPTEIEKPVIANYQDSDSAILIAALTSDTLNPEEIRSIVDQDLKPRVDRADGVASVEVYGGRERKILVELDRDKMFAYDISIEEVMDRIGAANVSLLAGSYERGSYDFAVRTLGAFKDIKQIGDLGIKASRQGSIIPLKEIATIKDSYLEPEDYARLNLSPNVSLYVKKVSLSNTIEVSDSVQRIYHQFEKERKGEIRVVVVSDKAKLIKRAIGDVKDALFLGIFLVAGIIYLSLRKWVLSAIVSLTIPVSVIPTFFFMDRLGFSINVMTLSGLALSIGIMVDSAIVVVENVSKKRERGAKFETAVVDGAEEMWLPLLASLMTDLCVFIPVMFVNKDIQLMYKGFAVTISIALALSLITAVMLVPVLLLKARRFLLNDHKPQPFKLDFLRRFTEPIKDFLNRKINPIKLIQNVKGLLSKLPFHRFKFNFQNIRFVELYGQYLEKSFRARYPLFAILVVLFLFTSWKLTTRAIDLPTQLEENEFQVVIFPLAGAKLDTNNEAAKRVEEFLHQFKEVDMISTTVQKDDLKVFVRLVPRTQRQLSKDEIMTQVREKGNEMIKQIHDEYSLIVDEGATTEESKKLVINIFGLENDELEKLAHEIAQKISGIKGLTNLVMTDLRKRPEYSVVVDKGRAAYYGLSVRQIADSIHAQVRGMRPTKFHEISKGEEIETITRLQPIYRQKVEDLESVYLVSPKDGTQVSLKQVAGLYPSRGPQTIDRKDKYRYVFLKGDVHRPLETVAKEVKHAIHEVKMPSDYFWRFGGQYDELMRGKMQLATGVVLSILLVYMVLACLYQSYTEPLMIMLAIPLGVIGVWAALEYTNKPLSEQVFLGMFILVGYVVHSSIILVDRINVLKDEIPDIIPRLVRAGEDRLRPILITTASTIVGFLPMAVSRSESSELWAPLSITMIGGSISSTLLTLFIIPNFYLYVEDAKKYFKNPTDFNQKTFLLLKSSIEKIPSFFRIFSKKK